MNEQEETASADTTVDTTPKKLWTPGPWLSLGCIHGEGRCRCGSICAEFGNSYVVANVNSQRGIDSLYDSEVPTLNEARGNAMLIAAAPELFEALVIGLRAAESCACRASYNNDHESEDSWDKKVAIIKAALAKALGGQP